MKEGTPQGVHALSIFTLHPQAAGHSPVLAWKPAAGDTAAASTAVSTIMRNDIVSRATPDLTRREKGVPSVSWYQGFY